MWDSGQGATRNARERVVPTLGTADKWMGDGMSVGWWAEDTYSSSDDAAAAAASAAAVVVGNTEIAFWKMLHIINKCKRK